MTPSFKINVRNLDNFKQAVESQKKLKFDGLFLSKKYILSTKTLYTEDLSTLLLTICLPYSLCHFWNHEPFFKTQVIYTFFKLKHYLS